MKRSILFLLSLLSFVCWSQNDTNVEREISVNQYINGSLLMPQQDEAPSLAIIIADSGPTDRNGNQNFMQNNALKKLAYALAENGISSYRYDKRIVKQIRLGDVDEDMMFDDFVSDAKDVFEYFYNSNSFSGIHIIGIGQGSLVGMLTAISGADTFISLAGAGKPIDEVLLDQINATAPMFNSEAARVFGVLRNGQTTMDYPEALASVFDISVQPFIQNWMQYDPSQIIKELEIPVLVVNGTKDLQVSTEEANLLHEAANDSELQIIENMNHVLFDIKGDDLENSKSYNESFRPISTDLVQVIVNFIRK